MAGKSGPQEQAKSGERIAKVMARAGLCSRREAEAWIAAGRVAVNGKPIASPALDVPPRDHVTVDGEPLRQRERTRLFLYHKPRGLLTSHADARGRPTIFAALPKGLPRLISVGRLDLNTEGLLLLTNDGGLARTLELPATGWLRRYRVRAHGRVRQEELDRLYKGITIDGIRYGSIEAKLEREQGANVWLTFAMREGKNREVKNVLGHLGLAVNRLIRVSFGPFQLGESGGRRGRGGEDAGVARPAGRAHHRALRRRFLGPDRQRVSGDRRGGRSRAPGAGAKALAGRPFRPRGRREAGGARHRPPTPKRKPEAGTRSAAATPSASASRSWRGATSGAAAARLPASGGALMRIVGGRLRGRALAAPGIAGDPADRRPAARGLVQHPRARLRGSGHRRARARPVRRHRRARARGALARRRLCAAGRRCGGGPRPVARQRRRRSGSAAPPASSGATPPRSAPRIRSSRSRWRFSIRPIGKGLAERALASARAGGWLTPDALIVVEEAADAGFAPPAGFEEIERRRYDDTELIFLRVS